MRRKQEINDYIICKMVFCTIRKNGAKKKKNQSDLWGKGVGEGLPL